MASGNKNTCQGPDGAIVLHDLVLESDLMVDFTDWFPLATVGLTCTGKQC
jgi:hypothetical protein